MTERNNIFIKNLRQVFNTQNNAQKWLFLLYTFLLVPNLLGIIRAFEVRMGLSDLTSLSDGILIIIAILGCYRVFLKHLRLLDIVFLTVIIICYYLSAYLFPQTATKSAENAGLFFFSCLPMYLVGRTVNKETSREMFVLVAYIATFIQIVFLLFLGMGVTDEGDSIDELMGISYRQLPFSLFLLWYAFEKRGLFNYVMAFVGVFLLLSLGTRGPIICMIVFIGLYFLFYKEYKHNIIVKTIIAIVACVFVLFSNEVAISLSQLSSSLGLSTRVFDSIVEGQMIDIQNSNGRDEVWSQTFSYLTDNNVLFGGGFYFDRIINSGSYYVHNLELELLCSFGIIGGAFVIVVLAWLILRAFHYSQRTDGSIILLVFFCSSILPLQLSSSFLQSKAFWFFLGMCITMQIKNSHKTVKLNN